MPYVKKQFPIGPWKPHRGLRITFYGLRYPSGSSGLVVHQGPS